MKLGKKFVVCKGKRGYSRRGLDMSGQLYDGDGVKA
jgi:hypothetical protein